MEATTLTPAELFGNQIRYVVPLYQRPYVWSRDAQWQPLWDDVVSVAERTLTESRAYGAVPAAPHFLGAIVIDHLPGPVSHIQAQRHRRPAAADHRCSCCWTPRTRW